MPQRLSTALGVDHAALDAAGVFDRFIGLDSLLHVDPHLLGFSNAPEMRAAVITLDRYWADAFAVLRRIEAKEDRWWRRAQELLTFPEDNHVGLGYACGSRGGAAVGRIKAGRLTETGMVLVQAGIEDTKLFELVGLFEPNIGADLISDITVHIARHDLLAYTERVCAELEIKTARFSVDNSTYFLPSSPVDGKYLVLLPKDVLRDLPVGMSWDDVDMVCMYNDGLRRQVNALIGDNWRQAAETHKKEKIKEVILRHPEVLADALKQYRSKKGTPYDFAKDVLGEAVWFEPAVSAVNANPMTLPGPATAQNIPTIVRLICQQFRRLVEDNGLWTVFYAEGGKLRHEKTAQRLFFAVADAYCHANNIDLSPECDSGNGPVDFKLSAGYNSRNLVEIKWSSNTSLVRGYTNQLDRYVKAEQAEHSTYLVIQVNARTTTIDEIKRLQLAAQATQRVPEIIVVDGQRRASASHEKPVATLRRPVKKATTKLKKRR